MSRGTPKAERQRLDALERLQAALFVPEAADDLEQAMNDLASAARAFDSAQQLVIGMRIIDGDYVGPYGNDEALILKDEGNVNGEVFGPLWHRKADGTQENALPGSVWVGATSAEAIAKERGLPLYYV